MIDRLCQDPLDPEVGFDSGTKVGAIRLFFFSPPASSVPLSVASRLTPLTELVVLRGVCGGVVIGSPVMKELPAAMPGRLPPTRGGLFMIVPAAGVAYEDCVAIEDVEFDLVGEDGRMVWPVGAGGGEGATERFEEVL